MELGLKKISLTELLPLRAKILRPGKKPEECIYDSDQLPDSFHLGAFDGDKLISVISIYKENFESLEGHGYRIRSMATDEEYRGKGTGSVLLNYAESEIRKLNCDYIWFNARSVAANFYLKNGYIIISDEFDIPGIGLHFVMTKRLIPPGKLSDTKHINIKDYTYNLPPEKIAFYPQEKRDESKLLIYKNKKISEDKFLNLSEYISNDSLLIFNNTKVIPGRFLFNSGEQTVEILCIEPFENKDYQSALSHNSSVKWECMIGKLKYWKDEYIQKEIYSGDKKIILKAKKHFQNNKFIVEFFWDPGELTFSEILDLAGTTPLPPYIKRDSEEKDNETYQTVYAENEGSIAAPTAGLHFTNEVLKSLQKKGVKNSFVTLHVNTGTFLPVKTDTIGKHKMHSEYVQIQKQTLIDLLNSENIIAVGTTSMRAVESLYWLSYLILNKKNFKDLNVTQWLPYENDFNISKNFSLQILIDYCDKHKMEVLNFKTALLITPGFKFRYFKGIITNFHQPQSTLLLLIAAFLGDEYKNVYQFALDNNFRFLSYGDSNLYLL